MYPSGVLTGIAEQLLEKPQDLSYDYLALAEHNWF